MPNGWFGVASQTREFTPVFRVPVAPRCARRRWEDEERSFSDRLAYEPAVDWMPNELLGRTLARERENVGAIAEDLLQKCFSTNC